MCGDRATAEGDPGPPPSGVSRRDAVLGAIGALAAAWLARAGGADPRPARAEVLDVRDPRFGARGDTRWAGNASVEDGSPWVTVPGAGFTARDVGKVIGIAHPAPLTATIVAVRSASEAVLSVPSPVTGGALRLTLTRPIPEPPGYAVFTFGDVLAVGGSAEVRSAGAGFTAADVGRTAWLGGVARSTIAAVDGSGRVRLAEPPGFASSRARVIWGTDDTAAVRAAAGEAARLGHATVRFPRGEYMVTTVPVAAGTTLQGDPGATLRRAPLTPGRFARMLDTGGHPWRSDADSPLLVVRGLTLSGERGFQGAYRNHELENAALLFLTGGEGAAAGAGRLRALVEGCTFRDAVGDGVAAYTNAALEMRDCAAVDCFRGGVTVTGGHTRVAIRGFTGGGTVHPAGIHYEVDGAGYGGSFDTHSLLEDVALEGGFDVGLGGGRSTFVARRIVCRNPPIYVYALRSVVRIYDSTFHVGPQSANSDQIVRPRDVAFHRCRFVAAGGEAPATAERSFAAVGVAWYDGAPGATGQRLRLVDCSFDVAPGVPPGRSYAVYLPPDSPAADNLVTLEGGEISARFAYGLYVSQGGRCAVTRARIAASTGVFLNSTAGYDFDVRLDGVSTTGATSIFLANATPGSHLACSNMEADERHSVVAAGGGASAFRYSGGRTVRVREDPNAPHRPVPGFVGDRARRAVPLAGAANEWVCTRAGFGSRWSVPRWEPVGPGR